MRHARLAPSASHRWMNCPGSIEATKGLSEDPANLEAACYGTGAHCFSEKLLRKGIFEADDRHLGKTFRYRFNDGPASLLVDSDFIQHVNVYLARVEELFRQGGKLTIEQLVMLDCIRADMFGHMDVLLDQGRKIVVADLKFGFVPVFLAENPDALLFNAFDEADINTQLLCYAAGALEMVQWLPEIVQLEVIQPRSFEVEPIQSIELPTAFVEDWVDKIAKPAAARAEDPNAPRVAGEWCRFCPAKMLPNGTVCPAFSEHNEAIVTTDFSEFGVANSLPDVEKLSTDQLLNILRWTPILDAFLREVNAHAFQLLMSGNKELAGFYKLVRGRGTRFWPFETPEETAHAIADYIATNGDEFEQMHFSTKNGVREVFAKVYEPLAVKSPKQIEDLGGLYKKAVQAIAKKRMGNPTLAVASDRRKEIEPFTEYADMGLGDE